MHTYIYIYIYKYKYNLCFYFKGKITRANITAVAAALALNALNRRVKVAVDLNTGLEMVGKRYILREKITKFILCLKNSNMF